MTIGGTLPLRKHGTLICWAIFLYAASRLGLSSSKGTSTVSLARVGLKVSTALFTGGSPQSSGQVSDSWPGLVVVVRRAGRAAHRAVGVGRSGRESCDDGWSGRQDSNLRSPAPKAGALATTLRPGFPATGLTAPVEEPPGVYGRGVREPQSRRGVDLWHHGAAYGRGHRPPRNARGC